VTPTWLDVPAGHPFGIHNLPYGTAGDRLWVRIGDQAFDLSTAVERKLVPGGRNMTLLKLIAFGPAVWDDVRGRLTELFTSPEFRADVEPLLVPVDELDMALPCRIGDYVDFYSSEIHATNLGKILRPGQPPLLPNWKHLPAGYHGRAGTVVVSGTEITRPRGQRKAPDADAPTFGPSQRLDIEAEVGFLVGAGSELGRPLSAVDFRAHVFGVVLVNDWSARDIQAWEYQPLGPFLGKSFATSVSSWVVPLAALDGAIVPAPLQDPPVLPYLRDGRAGYDIRLEVRWNGTLVARPPFRHMYWTPAQQLAHLTANGACVRAGDLFASGTVSGPRRDETGSFIELTWNGAEPVTLDDGSSRSFLADGDTVTITATAPGPEGSVIGFGDVTGTVRPAR
jgi:fumarylacetoacetase